MPLMKSATQNSGKELPIKRRHGESRAEDARSCPQHESPSATGPLHEQRGRHRGHRRANNHGAHRQRGIGRIRRKIDARQTAQGDQHSHIGAIERLPADSRTCFASPQRHSGESLSGPCANARASPFPQKGQNRRKLCQKPSFTARLERHFLPSPNLVSSPPSDKRTALYPYANSNAFQGHT